MLYGDEMPLLFFLKIRMDLSRAEKVRMEGRRTVGLPFFLPLLCTKDFKVKIFPDGILLEKKLRKRNYQYNLNAVRS